MKHRLIIATFAISLSTAAAHAQTTVDMGQVTCAQYLAMTPSMSQHFSAWVSGWVAYHERRTFVDVTLHQKNVASLKSWCQTNPQASLMGALKAAIGLK